MISEVLESLQGTDSAASIAVFLITALTVFLLVRIIFGSRRMSAAEPSAIHVPAKAFGALTLPLSFVFPHTAAKREKIRKELSDAGIYYSNALINFLSLRNVALMGCLTLLAVFFAAGWVDGVEGKALAIGLALAIFVHAIPRIILSAQAAKRVRQIEHGLPDALDMLAMSVEGGLPMGRALKRVASELGPTHPDLTDELKIIARQSEAGSFEQALGSFASRLQLPEVLAWSAMMQQSQRLGGNVVGGLREYADRIRATRKQRAERAGNAASLKLLLPVVLCLTPPVFIVLIGPAMLDFRDFIQRERDNHSAVIQQANLPEAQRLQDALIGRR